MRTGTTVLVVVALGLAMAGPAAAVVDVLCEADTKTESGYGAPHGDYNYGSMTQLQSRPQYGRVVYMRFDISAVGAFTTAELIVNPDNELATRVDIYGLNSGVTAYTDTNGKSRLGEDWVEGTGGSSGLNIYTQDSDGNDDPTNSDTSNDNWLTFNNAPGNLAYHPGVDNWTPDTNVTMLVDDCPVVIGGDGLATLDLGTTGVDHLIADADGLVTLIAVMPDNKFYFKSREQEPEVNDPILRLNASVGIPGDADGDGDVDGDDFNAWGGNFPTASGATLAQGDFDGDGDVDGDDFNVWGGNFPFPSAGASGSSNAIPEPTTLALMGLAGLALLRRKR